MSSYDLGWLAGTIDGEGSLSVTKRHRPGRAPTYEPVLQICSTDLETVERVQALVGSGSICVNPGNGLNVKTLYCYSVTSNGLRHILPKLKLVTKERQRVLVLKALGLLKNGRWRSKDRFTELESIWNALRRIHE